MKVRQPRAEQAPGRRNASLGHRTLGLFVRVVAQHEAQQQAGHDDVAEAQHGEVTRVVHARKDQFAREVELRRLPHDAAEIQLACDDPDGILGGSRGHLHHHICTEDVWREEHPKDVVDE